jgi:predicted RNA binding protein YcfA (HicA-like mRNA interferase family)
VKTPRDLSGADLARALRPLGYEVTRQHGSHLRITTQLNGEHHQVVPNHSPIKLGTLKSILRSVAAHHRMSAADLMTKLGW